MTDADKIYSFRDLNAWKIGHQFALKIYQMTKAFPIEEQFGLSSQLRRAAISITSNIAEGFSRRSYREKSQFYSMAPGSLTEVQNQLLLAKDIGYLLSKSFNNLYEDSITVHKLINGLIKKSNIIHNS